MAYRFKQEPPKYRKVDRILYQPKKLYVLRKRIETLGKWETVYLVVSPFAYRKGYFPRVDLLGEYIPNPKDLFVLARAGFFSLEREQPVTGDKLWEAMEKASFFKAYYVEPKEGGKKMYQEELTLRELEWMAEATLIEKRHLEQLYDRYTREAPELLEGLKKDIDVVDKLHEKLKSLVFRLQGAKKPKIVISISRGESSGSQEHITY